MVSAFGVRLSERAPEQGVHYQTASRWAREGNRSVPVVITPTGGVSSADQKPDVQRKAGRVALGALDQGISSERAVRDVGSRLYAVRPAASEAGNRGSTSLYERIAFDL